MHFGIIHSLGFCVLALFSFFLEFGLILRPHSSTHSTAHRVSKWTVARMLRSFINLFGFFFNFYSFSSFYLCSIWFRCRLSIKFDICWFSLIDQFELSQQFNMLDMHSMHQIVINHASRMGSLSLICSRTKNTNTWTNQVNLFLLFFSFAALAHFRAVLSRRSRCAGKSNGGTRNGIKHLKISFS